MNERGFFTLIGICFLLVAAILVKGVQESERNYIDITKDFKTEVDLQNIADSALIEAADMIELNEITLKEFATNVANRRENQHEINLKNHYDADVKVFYEYGKYISNEVEFGTIRLIKRTYAGGVQKDKRIGNKDKKGVILISVASREIDGNKVYRRALGYIFTDEDADGKIYFMNSL